MNDKKKQPTNMTAEMITGNDNVKCLQNTIKEVVREEVFLRPRLRPAAKGAYSGAAGYAI